MKGYKAFEKGLICNPTGNNPFQYAENTVFEQEQEANICNSGFHFCKNPLDVLDYYPLIDSNGDLTEFAEVEALDDCKTDDNKKFCTKKIKIGARISLPAFIKASFSVAYENIKNEVDEATKNIENGGYKAALAGGDEATLAGGNYATLAGGENSLIVGDNGSVAKGKKGTVILLVERDDDFNIINYSAVQVDGKNIKEDVLYKLENGKIKELKECEKI